MASPRRGATERTRIFLHKDFSPSGTVFVTTSSSICEFSSRSMAGPERMACVAQAKMFFAPFARSASADCTSVPAVSTMSSSMTAVFPSTSPMMFITAETFGPSRRLSMMASEAFSRLAHARALSSPPASGETTTMSSR